MTQPIGRYYLDMVLRRWKPVLAIVALCTLIAWLFTILVLVQFPKFEGAAKLNIVPTSEELGYASRFVRGSTFDGGSVLLQTYGEYAHTRPIVAPIVDRYIAESAKAQGISIAAWTAANAQPSPFAPGPWISWLQYGATPPRPPRDNLIDKLVQNTTLATVEGTYLLQVTVDWSDPVSAAWLTNALADSIVDQADAMSHQTGSQIAGGLEARLASTQAELAGKLRQSRTLKNSLGVVDIDRQKQSLLEDRLAQQALLTTDRSDLSAARARVADLQSRAHGKLSVTQLQVQATLASEAPRLDGLARGIPVREARIAAIGAQLATLGRNEQAVKQLDDEIDILQTQVKSLDERVSFSQNENLANAPRIKLIERAVPPPVRTSPKALFNTVLGFLAGCALAGCWLLLFDLGERESAEDRRAEHDPVPEGPPEDETPAPVHHAQTATFLADSEPVHDSEPWEDHAVEAELATEPVPEPGPVAAMPVFGADADAPAPVEDDAAIGHDAATLAEDEAQAAIVEADDVTHATATADVEAEHDVMVIDKTEDAEAESLPLPVAGGDAGTPRPLCRIACEPEGRVFSGRVPRPANGTAYRADEIARFGPRIAEWLKAPLARPGQPLVVVATGEDRDAQTLYRLLHDHLRTTGMPIRVLDGTLRPIPPAPEPSETLALIYGGGFAQSGRLALLTELDADIVVAVGATGDKARGVLAEFQDSVAGIAGRTPYVVALGR